MSVDLIHGEIGPLPDFDKKPAHPLKHHGRAELIVIILPQESIIYIQYIEVI